MVVKLLGEKIGVKTSCRILQISRSGFYAWLKRPKSKRDLDSRELIGRMRKIHDESRGTYGAPRITEALKAQGGRYGHNRVAKLMRKSGLSGCAKRRFRVKTTDSNHDLPIAPRIFQVEEPATLPTKPNEVWVGDITYVPTGEGWLYLSMQLDVFTRKIVGYALTDHLRTEAVLEALQMAVQSQDLDPVGKLISHSDRGCQYASESYRQELKALGITASMSRRGNCYDNAYAESFFHSLKVELVHRREFKTRAEATRAIFEYIEVWYNRRRLHSSLGYLSPADYEAKALAA
jgi:putative transposase